MILKRPTHPTRKPFSRGGPQATQLKPQCDVRLTGCAAGIGSHVFRRAGQQVSIGPRLESGQKPLQRSGWGMASTGGVLHGAEVIAASGEQATQSGLEVARWFRSLNRARTEAQGTAVRGGPGSASDNGGSGKLSGRGSRGSRSERCVWHAYLAHHQDENSTTARWLQARARS